MERQYRNSGIAWATQIPSNWKVIRGKNLLKLMNRPVRETDDVVTCFRDGEVILRSERRTEGFTMSDKEIGYQGINKGDIVIHGMDGFAGSMGVSKSTGKGSPVLVVCNPKEDDDSRYIVYYLRALAINNVFLALATGIRERSCDLRWNKISELPFIRPEADEQKRIADYIDAKIEDIDRLITLQEQMIAHLTNYKQSVITEAVTKGLNPDVKLVPSGINWIGDLPKGWKVTPIKWLMDIFAGATPKSDDDSLWDGDIPWITPADYKTEDIYVASGRRNISEKGLQSCATTLLPIGSIIFSKRAPIGLVAINNNPLCTNQGCLGCITKSNLANNKFFYFTLSIFKEQFELYGSGTTFKEISATNFANFAVPVPPIDEQRAIAEYLNTKCGEIDKLIETKRKKIDTLKEYKKSVIYEAVTGNTMIQ